MAACLLSDRADRGGVPVLPGLPGHRLGRAADLDLGRGFGLAITLFSTIRRSLARSRLLFPAANSRRKSGVTAGNGPVRSRDHVTGKRVGRYRVGLVACSRP